MYWQDLQESVYEIGTSEFDNLALAVFRYQSQNCRVYHEYLHHLRIDSAKVDKLEEIPCLPIEFFKYFQVMTGDFNAEVVFESSSTSGKGVSIHSVKSKNTYEKAFCKSFNQSFRDHRSFCHFALLPSYLERGNSSLVYQVNHFIQESNYTRSSFFLHNFADLEKALLQNESEGVPTILWGVTYALLDFAAIFRFPLKHTTIIETGGMKGKREEITRENLHEILTESFDLPFIAGEYGMTELMSQAYSSGKGLYHCPPWMKVSVREINDPLGAPIFNRHGAINIIDLANLDTCAFIETSDLGKVYKDGSFEILGRIDYSDTRGCNLLV